MKQKLMGGAEMRKIVFRNAVAQGWFVGTGVMGRRFGRHYLSSQSGLSHLAWASQHMKEISLLLEALQQFAVKHMSIQMSF